MTTESLTFGVRPGNLAGAMQNVYIAGAGMTRVGRHSEPLQELMADAAHGALAEAGIERPGMLVVAAMNPEEFLRDGNLASNVATYLGLADTPAYAHFQQAVTAEEVMESRMVAEPLRLLHCCPISDGAPVTTWLLAPPRARLEL